MQHDNSVNYVLPREPECVTYFPKATGTFKRYQTERSRQKAMPRKSKAMVYHIVSKRQRQRR